MAKKYKTDADQVARNFGWQAAYHMVLSDDYEWDDTDFKKSAIDRCYEEWVSETNGTKKKKNFKEDRYSNLYDLAKRRALIHYRI